MRRDTYSWVYPCRPLWVLTVREEGIWWEREIHISCPASRTLAICVGKERIEWLGINHEALMSCWLKNLRSLSVPVLAPKMPRERSLAFAFLPVVVLSLVLSASGDLYLMSQCSKYLPAGTSVYVDAVAD